MGFSRNNLYTPCWGYSFFESSTPWMDFRTPPRIFSIPRPLPPHIPGYPISSTGGTDFFWKSPMPVFQNYVFNFASFNRYFLTDFWTNKVKTVLSWFLYQVNNEGKWLTFSFIFQETFVKNIFVFEIHRANSIIYLAWFSLEAKLILSMIAFVLAFPEIFPFIK